jgi:ferredoxin-NADP reductase
VYSPTLAVIHSNMIKKTFPLKIIKKYKETPVSYSFTLRITDDLKSKFKFICGQYITVHLRDNNGRQQSRRYSITSLINEQNISFCVKRVPKGLVSNLLHDEYNVGDTLEVSPPSGNFILNDHILEEYQNLVFVTGGSGITPVKAMINHAIANKFSGNIYLIYANRDIRSIIFYDHLQEIQQHNCHFVFTIDEPTEGWTREVGQLSKSKIEEIFCKHKIPYKDTCFFTTGPSIIIEILINHLKANQVHHTNIKSENFDLSPLTKGISTETQQIKIKFKGNTHIVTVGANQNILDATLDAGFNIDHECKMGNCLSCEAVLKSGKVYSAIKQQDDSDKIITCTSYPLNDQVVVNFDKSILQSITKRNNLIILGFIFSFFILLFLTAEPNESCLAKGPMNTGHENLKCVDCHKSAPGSTRQQLQYNAKTFLNLTDGEYVDFGKLRVNNTVCLNCHSRPNDVHPTHRFLEPRFIKAREAIQPENCISCHNEHNGKRVTIVQANYCQHCHQDIKVNNDPLDLNHEQLIYAEKWNTCLQCHDYHGNHIFNVPKRISDTISLQSLKIYFNGGEDPYSDIKKYITDSIVNKTRENE